jgi:hypothetical protein
MDRLARRLGLSGFPVNLHVHFRGRLDLSQLQDAADRLVRRWPLLTARLVRTPRPAWVPTGAQSCHVRQETLDSDSEAALLAAASRLAAHPFDVENDDPLQLSVWHRPGGDDVLTIQFSHILMDGHGAFALVQQLLDPTRIPALSDAAEAPTDFVEQVLAKIPFRDRMKAVRRMIGLMRGVEPLCLPVLHEAPPAGSEAGRITLRWIDETASTAFRERLARIGPFANPTLAVLASGCRTLSRYVPGPLGTRSGYVMLLPFNLRRSQQKRLLFQNFVTRFVLVARPDELKDRDALIRLFVSQVRTQIAEKTIVATLVMVRLLSKLERWAPRLVTMARPRPRSVNGSSWGEDFESGTPAFGAVVDYGWVNTPFMPMPGVSLNLIKVGRRQLAVFLHSPRHLSDERASQFLDEWLEDLFRP